VLENPILKRHWRGQTSRPLILIAVLLLARFGEANAQVVSTLPACPPQRSSDEWDQCVGVWHSPEGDIAYSGEFGDGTFHGYGVLFVGGSRYSGQFRQGRMHGQGVLLLDDGQTYVGAFEEGVISGFGRLLGADGREAFVGQFVDGEPAPNATVANAPPAAEASAAIAPAERGSGQPGVPAAAAPPTAAAEYSVGDAVEVVYNGFWYPARIKAINGPGQWLIGYDRYSESWDEVVGRDRIRAPGAQVPTAPVQTNGQAGTRGGQVAQGAAAPQPQAGAGSWPAAPTGASTPIEGVFLTVRTWMSGSVDMEAWFFTRNGRFSRAPQGGVTLQALATRQTPGKGEGTYWVEGSELVLAWADGREPWRSSYKADPNSLIIGTQFASKWSGFPKGWRFDGAYEGGASISGGALSSSSSLVFRGDGTFSRQAVLNVSSEGRASSVSGGATGGAVGTYEFDEFSLALTENGTSARYTVFGYGERDAAGRPDQIFWQGLLLRRLNK
jgi:hypothetical protein